MDLSVWNYVGEKKIDWKNGGMGRLDCREREEKNGDLVKQKGKEKNVSVIFHFSQNKGIWI